MTGQPTQPQQLREMRSPIQAMPNLEIPVMITITDPVARRRCVLDSQEHIAHCALAEPGPPPLNSGPPLPAGDEGSGVPGGLGTRMIDGVSVVGYRTQEMVDFRGSKIVVTTQTWYSRDLELTMLRQTVDPRFGESTYRLENFSRAEPDPGLFYSPAGYVVREESGPFKIEYSNQ